MGPTDLRLLYIWSIGTGSSRYRNLSKLDRVVFLYLSNCICCAKIGRFRIGQYIGQLPISLLGPHFIMGNWICALLSPAIICILRFSGRSFGVSSCCLYKHTMLLRSNEESR